MNELRAAIVGCGSIFTMHATPLAAMEDVCLAGVCDCRRERAERAAEKYRTRAFTDYREMLTTLRPDVVHLCVPHDLHPVMARFALEHGIHVLSEKPMSIRLEDALENVRLAEANHLRYGVVFQCRYNDASVLVKRTLDSGELGKILSARSVLTWCKPDSYYAQSDWKGTWDREGGGVVIDQAIHSLDLVNWFLQSEPVKVDAYYANRGHDLIEVEDSAEGLITYANGVRYGFWAMNSYACDEPIEIRLCCERGKVVMTYDDAWIAFADGRELHVRQGEDRLCYEGGKEYWGFQHVRQIRQFYDSVRAGVEPEISGREALKIQRIIGAFYESGRTGKPVVLSGETNGNYKRSQ